MIISLSFLIHNISTIMVSPSNKTVSVKWDNEYKDLRTVPGIQQTLSMSWGIVIILLVILIKFLDNCSRLSRYYSLSAPPVQLPVKRWVSLVEEGKNCCPLLWNSQESFLSKSRFPPWSSKYPLSFAILEVEHVNNSHWPEQIKRYIGEAI